MQNCFFDLSTTEKFGRIVFGKSCSSVARIILLAETTKSKILKNEAT